jgi:hypothetical protein
LRKAISTIVIACAFVAGASGVADATGSNAKGKKCGTLYTPKCTKAKPKKHKPKPPPPTTKPNVTAPMSPGCRTAGTADKLPTFTFVSNAGLRKIKVVFQAKTLKVVTFKGKGPKQFKMIGVRVPTKGLAAGAHSVTVTAVDVKGKSASRTVRFTICQAKPVFTG